MTTNEIRTRIFNVVPAATWQMEQLLGLLDIVIDETISSACVDCNARPRLRLNPKFIERYCKTDEHLLMLVLHELHHVVLGHTMLFPRPTTLHNIAFDAIINAMLCHQFPEKRYHSFFTSTNSEKTFPSRLLRPPKGWPTKSSYPDDMGIKEEKILHLLYSSEQGGITYLEVFELLLKDLELADGKFILLGNHLSEENEVGIDPFFGQAIRDIVSKWPKPDRVLKGIQAGTALPWQLPEASPSVKLRSAISKLLRQTGVLPPTNSTHRQLTKIDASRTIETVIPQSRDRRLPAWKTLNGMWPIIYRGEIVEPRIRRAPIPQTHVYLDISGSMTSVIPAISAAVKIVYKQGLIRMFVFSTVVCEVTPKNLHGDLQNTYGTDINCILAHLISLPRHKRPRKVLIITDGYVGRPNEDLANQLTSITFYIALSAVYNGLELKPLNPKITRLPI